MLRFALTFLFALFIQSVFAFPASMTANQMSDMSSLSTGHKNVESRIYAKADSLKGFYQTNQALDDEDFVNRIRNFMNMLHQATFQ
ncbi:hypothetical protein TNIN_155531 [Trichonephila inaurata madagascariensis]|uniref:Uncharacterized protein n=1 Tax=Trichonephila inaurata madagascariensis TaxID=2747483 RepID=A0A8X6YUG5_9ARAC|nr:hypothetical protein TNIN_155531 [Trichonephila inaurata madagascariensis]